jgi:hypothetical protein
MDWVSCTGVPKRNARAAAANKLLDLLKKCLTVLRSLRDGEWRGNGRRKARADYLRAARLYWIAVKVANRSTSVGVT